MTRKLTAVIKTLWRYMGKGLNLIYRFVFYSLPFIIVYIVGQEFISGKLLKETPTERYYVLFISAGLAATISGLSFRACQSSPETEKAKAFYYSGERLFHATILLAVSIVLEYS